MRLTERGKRHMDKEKNGNEEGVEAGGWGISVFFVVGSSLPLSSSLVFLFLF